MIDYNLGTISRSSDSSIPNYAKHNVVREKNGKLNFESNPRNPELNILYQIHVSYSYVGTATAIDNKSQFISDALKEKLIRGDDVKIVVSGDSISVGAQTTAQYFHNDPITDTFAGLLRYELEKAFNSKIELELLSEGGTSRQYLISNFDAIINTKPDVVIVEFGMNDHAVSPPIKFA